MKQKRHRHLRAEDRDIIERLRKAGSSQREIAAILGFSQSTISKEMARNLGLRGYRAGQAQRLAVRRKRDKRPRNRVVSGEMVDEIESQLSRKHSPEQISGTLRRSHGQGPCHETIYAYIREDVSVTRSAVRYPLQWVFRCRHRQSGYDDNERGIGEV